MSKKTKSSGRASTGAFGGGFGFGSGSAFGSSASLLSYVSEPPDLSPISDANTVVAFKNLTKKDSTTKAKALEDLQSYVASAGAQLEEGVIDAWVQLYPRSSIDSERRVRQLAHTVHGKIAAASGKRIARHMPNIVGAWLAGLYDNDKAVAKSAQDAFNTVFPTPEKLRTVRKAFQQQTLEYCRTVIDKEAVDTLSDERNTSPDDALAKYNRVIASSISVIATLLMELQLEDIAKEQASYEEVIQDSRLWEFASYDDPAVRRAVHRLLRICISKQPDVLSANLSTIAKSYLAKSLSSKQPGSAWHFSEATVALSEAYPAVWTEQYKKKTVIQRLPQWLKRGSEGGPTEFWDNVTRVVSSLPRDVLPVQLPEAVEVLNAMHSGITSKDEPRPNLSAAFKSYFKVASTLSAQLPEDEQSKLLTEMVLPIVAHYVKPSAETSTWAIPAPRAPELIKQALEIPGMSPVLDDKWQQLTETLIEDMKTSLPAQSKDYDMSQKGVGDEGHRWAIVGAAFLGGSDAEPVKERLARSSSQVLREALTLLKSRNGKPYGAAAIIESMIQSFKQLLLEDAECSELLIPFIKDDLPALFISPSSLYLASTLYAFTDRPEFAETWNATLKKCIEAPEPEEKLSALTQLLSAKNAGNAAQLASSNTDLQSFVLERFQLAIEGSTDWTFLGQVLRNSTPVLSDSTTDTILSELTKSLSISEKAIHAIQGLSTVVERKPELLKEYASKPEGSELLGRVFYLTESPDDHIAGEASSLESRIKAALSTEGSGNAALKSSMFDVIQKGLLEASHESVSPATLVELAQSLLQSSDLDRTELVEKLLPSKEAWKTALAPFLKLAPHPSLAITNALGGAVYLVDSQETNPPKMSRDNDGWSPALRMAWYTSRLLKTTEIFESIPIENRAQIYQHLLLAVQLTNDNLSRASSNDIWNMYNPHTESEIVDFISEAQLVMNDFLYDKSLQSSFNQLLEAATGSSAESFYNARAYTYVMSRLLSLVGSDMEKTPDLDAKIKDLRKSQDVFYSTAFIVGHCTMVESRSPMSQLCNELIAQLTGIDMAKKAKEALGQLVLLNALLQNQPDIAETVAQRRLIFFVQHIAKSFDPEENDGDVPFEVKAEAFRALTTLLPYMKDIYGEHWSSLLNALPAFWSIAEEANSKGGRAGYDLALPCIHASLKMFAALRKLKNDEEVNDDLVDAWKETEAQASTGLVGLLKQSEGLDDSNNQPLQIVNELLSRQIAAVPVEQLKNTEELFPLLVTESSSVQQAAFDILHKQIPEAQQQLSVDAALEKKNVRLPEELLSLVLEAPSAANLGPDAFRRTMPLNIRGYLFSWLLVFDHFSNSSYKVKADYIENLNEEGYVSGLLGFVSDFLGHTRGKPVDVSKFDVTMYDASAAADNPEKDAQYLSAHLYFLTLKYLSSLSRAWWIDTPRHVRSVVESWTERHISTHIIADALESVSEWANSQSGSEDEQLTVKVNPRAKEVQAGYEVDEQFMLMAIRLPPTYPLFPVQVEGMNRVAASEAKWQTWLRNTQGVVTFSNGNLVDGLIAWRRNVVGALKGQTECAICYSIVSADKSLPSKRCSTCKNLFHSSCLFKWFKTSNASSCPLCRNAFNYG
ncbi:uncharacterized protein K452DRAFT_348186 [Aplosporella prunicola CBS 121167]|uniref:E3 ubiquitin-protein ligase listerin n=1 Tax=Aplosporella prunicola CBS 121167 TaxID=1176127 RepID=A0A6A6BTT5_9PEZI|nr:uncharacterized protein K452DRAFT_348186 [Aplosporella prunicola CBS 121167]KAF2147496.1 hypothetical protein K452DRAFT_348186 [Aplosporella prunicola CBS 121167]